MSTRIAIFLPNWIGDVVMATPTLRALRTHFGPTAHLLGVARPYVLDVLAGTTWLDETFAWNPRDSTAARRSPALLEQLRRASPDVAVLLTNSLRPAWIAWRGGARRRVGYARNFRSWLLTDRLAPLREGWRYLPTPVLDSYLELAYALGCPWESPRLELATTLDDERAADAVWRRAALPLDERVVIFNTGGAFGAAKDWPRDSFAELARRIVADTGHSVLIVCGPQERATARSIVAAVDDPRVTSLADDAPSIGLTKACIRRARLLVTTDSGPRHFAAAFGVPSVTLFGPTHQAWSDNHDPLGTHVQLKLACQPCQRRSCPLGHHACMRDLSVAQVWQTVAAQLSSQRRRAA